jgi:hypothetical protein
MCFCAEIPESHLADTIAFGADFLREKSAPESDPGLCVVNVDDLMGAEDLVRFGTRAKKRVLSKSQAYETARLLGIHLSEHGGTGQGVIGALAGTGLRLGGNDGRFKGWIHFEGKKRGMKAARLYDSPFVDMVCTPDGTCIPPDSEILVDYEVKTVLLHHKAAVLVTPTEGQGTVPPWRTLKKRELKRY